MCFEVGWLKFCGWDGPRTRGPRSGAARGRESGVAPGHQLNVYGSTVDGSAPGDFQSCPAPDTSSATALPGSCPSGRGASGPLIVNQRTIGTKVPAFPAKICSKARQLDSALPICSTTMRPTTTFRLNASAFRELDFLLAVPGRASLETPGGVGARP
jgi:hypothetical protein